MYQFNAINLDNGTFIVHPLREEDMNRQNDLIQDIYEIFSDDETTIYTPEKKVESTKVVSDRLNGVVHRYHRGESFTHYITLKKINKVIGVIDIISPSLVEKDYDIKDTWFIEYFLNKELWGRGIMSGIVGAIVNTMKKRGINRIGALCDSNNIRSVTILKKIGFKMTKHNGNQYLFTLE